MEDTLKMMKLIITGKEKETDEKTLIEQYKAKLSPNILAYFFINNFGIIKRFKRIYLTLLEDDIVSYCLQELDNCLQKYDGKISKFSTYFYKCCSNRLNVEYRKSKTIKNKIINEWQYLEDTPNVGYNYIEFDFENILNTYKLTPEEKHQCRLLNFGYSIKEVAKILKLSPSSISYRNKKIKQKILASD